MFEWIAPSLFVSARRNFRIFRVDEPIGFFINLRTAREVFLAQWSI